MASQPDGTATGHADCIDRTIGRCRTDAAMGAQ
jgi:hypothetical protein